MVCASARKYSPLRSASAKLVPSAEMPKPENIRRIVTGPKSANKSIRKSRSMEVAHDSASRPGERRDPYAVLFRLSRVVDAFFKKRRQGLWVPAFAGTTRRPVKAAQSPIDLGGRQRHRFAAPAGAG